MNEEMKFADICRFIGKLVLDYHHDMENLNNKYLSSMEDFRMRMNEKNAQIKKLENKLELLGQETNGSIES